MNLYSVLLFVHVIGAIGYATGTLMSLLGLSALRGARRVEQARSILEFLELTAPVSGISLLFTIAAGLYMAATTWGWRTGWINVTLATLVLLLAMGILMGTRRHAITLQLKEMADGPLPEAVEQRIFDPWMGLGIYMLSTLVPGVIFLMTVKPAFAISLMVIGIALIVGLALALLNWRRSNRESESVSSAKQEGRT